MGLDIYGILLVFIFGLRHGLAADHIAVIDGLGMYLSRKGGTGIVPWLGTLFAMGHGLVIAVFIILTSLGIESVLLDEPKIKWLEWFPVGLLFVIAFLNLRTLLNTKAHQHTLNLHKKSVKKNGVPWHLLLISVCMIMILDTLTDAAAWGYSATATSSVGEALIIGTVFTFGMLITDTVDSRILAKTIQSGLHHGKVSKQRRLLSWVIVVFSFGIGLQKMLTLINPSLELPETIELFLGLFLVMVVAVSYINIYKTLTPKRLSNERSNNN